MSYIDWEMNDIELKVFYFDPELVYIDPNYFDPRESYFGPEVTLTWRSIVFILT